MDKLDMQTKNIADENYEILAKMFPNALTETITGYDENGNAIIERAIDADVLRQEISCKVVEGKDERYQFTWPDKKKSVMLANSPISATFRPCKEISVNFDATENIYIEGDNLDALKLLQETYLNKIKMIYIDPPYNTGNNLIYRNDFHATMSKYLENSGQFDEQGNYMVQNPESNGRFHTEWLNMMYMRLRLSKNLLSDDGVLVCAIDENEVDTLSLLLKEIFGESSYEHTCVTVVHNPRGQQGTNFSHTNEYALFVYPKGIKAIADRKIEEEDVSWSQLRNWGSESERTDAKNCFYPIIVKDGKIVDFGKVSDDNYHPNQTEFDGEYAYVYPIDKSGVERKWRYARQTVESIKEMLRVRKNDSGYEIEIGKTFGVQRTVWADKRYDANEYGTKIINELVPNNGFSFPKSLWTVYDSIFAGTANDKEAIILDFFSGSATTAHAVMKMNAEDGGKRKFILVQVPEKIKEGSDSYNAGYDTICKIGEERIRKAGRAVLQEYPESQVDVGVRIFRLASSNMKDVYYNPAQMEQQTLFASTDNIKEDRTPEDLLFQVMLDLGVLLSSKIEEKMIAGKKVFNVADGFLIACFDNDITEETVKAVARQRPYYAVFRDSSMANDSVATNFEQIFATYSPETVRKVL